MLDSVPWHAPSYAGTAAPGRRPAPFVVENPMPATPQEVEELRALLRWAKADRGNAAAGQLRERALRDGLEKAIAYLAEPDSRVNVVRFILSALRQSMVRQPGLWVCRDRDLQTWALDQVATMFPPDPDDKVTYERPEH